MSGRERSKRSRVDTMDTVLEENEDGSNEQDSPPGQPQEQQGSQDPPVTGASTTQALWWQSYGCHIPELQKVAIRILSLICSATGCERNWSTFDQIHTKRRNCLEQSRMNALVFVKYNLALKDRHANRDSGTNPIVLEEMCDDDEWIVEKETPVLPNETTWLNIVDCFMEEQTNEVGESSHRRRRPRDLTKTLKGKNNAQEDDGDFIPTEDENEELDETEINLVNVLHEGPSA